MRVICDYIAGMTDRYALDVARRKGLIKSIFITPPIGILKHYLDFIWSSKTVAIPRGIK